MRINQDPNTFAIIGAGGFGREVACVVKKNLNELKLGQFIGFFDDNHSLPKKNDLGEIIGDINILLENYDGINLFIAVANPIFRLKIFNRLNELNFKFPNLINSDFNVLNQSNFKIGEGNIIFSRSSVSTNVQIGNFNILNSNISIGHDTVIGNFNTLMPGTKISGDVKVDNMNSFGINSGVLQGVEIGNNINLGPASILYKNPKDDSTYLGNPAKKFQF